MEPGDAIKILDAWDAKLAGRPLTPGEERILLRYRAIAQSMDMRVYDMLIQIGDEPDDV
jgi:hypothetical protein